MGQRMMGSALKDDADSELSSEQILKHIVHRDAIGAFMYVKDRARYEGGKYSHDLYA